MKKLTLATSVFTMGLLLVSCGAKPETVETSNKTPPAAAIETAQKKAKPKKKAAKTKSAKKGTPTLAGLKIGMTPKAVRKIVEKNGYEPAKIHPEILGPSFEQLLELARNKKVSRKDYKTTKTLRYDKLDSKENLTIEFESYEKGPLVGRLHYGTSAQNLTDEIFLDRAKKKFGEPSRERANSARWDYVQADGSKITIVKGQGRGLSMVSKGNVNLTKLIQERVQAEIKKNPAKTDF